MNELEHGQQCMYTHEARCRLISNNIFYRVALSQMALYQRFLFNLEAWPHIYCGDK